MTEKRHVISSTLCALLKHPSLIKSSLSLAESSLNLLSFSGSLAMLIMFCEYDMGYIHRLTPLYLSKILQSFIDRVNIGNARVAGLQADLKMSDYQYSLALTITYIPYIIVETPASLVLKRVSANMFLPTMVVHWGLTTTLQGLVGSYQGLLTARFFLGLFEGGLLPGIMLVMS